MTSRDLNPRCGTSSALSRRFLSSLYLPAARLEGPCVGARGKGCSERGKKGGSFSRGGAPKSPTNFSCASRQLVAEGLAFFRGSIQASPSNTWRYYHLQKMKGTVFWPIFSQMYGKFMRDFDKFLRNFQINVFLFPTSLSSKYLKYY